MGHKLTFTDICNRLAARQCRNAGQPVKTIARSAKRTPSTIYRWLRDTKHLEGR